MKTDTAIRHVTPPGSNLFLEGQLPGGASVSARPLYLDKSTVAQFIALSETTVERPVREDGFPKPRVLSGRRVA
ncbi:hypothetical protein BKP43_33610 [Variovorax boronicumulans]|uniref:helix-turn-helix transcriptional regulator n=1 Tax=Variovorax boronicumulans TaxID=436515 RepID=UPI00209C6A52|nr:AlpA family phage regulatory protein [Variovorax boronicumulans]PBI88580.1 hypothetical protein BKP43_33610 [Variovorax boronicumulans]